MRIAASQGMHPTWKLLQVAGLSRHRRRLHLGVVAVMINGLPMCSRLSRDKLRRFRMTPLSVLIVAFFLLTQPRGHADSGEEFFETKVRPVLAEHCFECHGPAKQESGLRLDSRKSILKGGDSGPSAVPGRIDDSLIVHAVRYIGDVKMPPVRFTWYDGGLLPERPARIEDGRMLGDKGGGTEFFCVTNVLIKL